jgi:hypothetical protein
MPHGQSAWLRVLRDGESPLHGEAASRQCTDRGEPERHAKGGYGPLANERQYPVMSTGLERIAAKARPEPTLRFTSLAHHIDAARLWHNLCHVPRQTAPESDGQTVDELHRRSRPGVRQRCMRCTLTALDHRRSGGPPSPNRVSASNARSGGHV